MHSSILLTDASAEVMIDCGADWRRHIGKIGPDAVLLTHAHPDHAGGLKTGSPCTVFATLDTWQVLKNYPLHDRRTIAPYAPFRIGKFTFEAFPVEHSLRAPAVGFRINSRIFYIPDVVSIPQRSQALAGVEIYIGDGATIVRPIIRRRGESLIGHASIAAQVGWCQEEGIPRAIFTHCGSQIVTGDEKMACARVRELAQRAGIDAALAYDGLEITPVRGHWR